MIQKKGLALFLFLFILFAVPVFSFSDVAIGGAFFKNTKDFGSGSLLQNGLYGANGRFRFGTLQLDALGLYNAGSPGSVDLIMDAEGNFDFLFINISGGIGPNFYIPTNGNNNAFTYGVNAKVNVDFRVFRKLTFGLSYVYMIDDVAQKNGSSSSRSLLGATILIW